MTHATRQQPGKRTTRTPQASNGHGDAVGPDGGAVGATGSSHPRPTKRPLARQVRLRLRPTSLLPGWTWPPPRTTLVRLGLAGAVVLLSTFTNRTFVGWGLLATVAVLFVPVGRARSFMLSFVPYAGVWFIFSALRSLADETSLAAMLNAQVWRFERWIFGGTLPTISLQDRFYNPDQLRPQDYLLTFVHWSYFVVPHAVAARLWHRDPAVFRHYVSAQTLLLGVGLCIYFLIPSDPPWLSPDPVNSPAAVQVERVMDPVGKSLSGGLYSASYKVIGESNPIAAMPSIHMAITFLLVFVARRAGPRWTLASLVYSLAMGVALVYLGEHYVVDVVVGMLVAGYGWFAAGTWFGRGAPGLPGRLSAPSSLGHPGRATV